METRDVVGLGDDGIAGAVYGHLCGDALGVPYEFQPPEAIDEVVIVARAVQADTTGAVSNSFLNREELRSAVGAGSDDNSILSNSIYGNGGLGIDLGIAIEAAQHPIDEQLVVLLDLAVAFQSMFFHVKIIKKASKLSKRHQTSSKLIKKSSKVIKKDQKVIKID